MAFELRTEGADLGQSVRHRGESGHEGHGVGGGTVARLWAEECEARWDTSEEPDSPITTYGFLFSYPQCNGKPPKDGQSDVR